MKYIMPKSCQALAKKQRTSGDYWEQIKDEIKHIKAAVNAPVSGNILDIGCGVGGLMVAMYHEVMDIKARGMVQGLDYDFFRHVALKYGITPTGEKYNLLTATAEMMQQNGVERYALQDAGNRPEYGPKSFDLIVSTLSWCYHYPPAVYLDMVKKALTDYGVLIVDVRDGTGWGKEIAYHFDRCEILAEGNKRSKIAFYEVKR